MTSLSTSDSLRCCLYRVTALALATLSSLAGSARARPPREVAGEVIAPLAPFPVLKSGVPSKGQRRLAHRESFIEIGVRIELQSFRTWKCQWPQNCPLGVILNAPLLVSFLLAAPRSGASPSTINLLTMAMCSVSFPIRSSSL